VPFQTGALSTELKMPMKNAANDWVTIGLQITHDVAGDARLKRTSLQPAINYHKNLGNENYLSLAFMGGPVNSQFDPTRLKWDDQFVAGSYNPANPTAQVFNNTGYTYWDASVGLTYTGVLSEETRFYAGAGLFHFNNPKLNFYSNNGQFSVLGRKFVQVYADYFNQAGASQFLGGFLYGIEFVNRYDDNKSVNLNLGAFFRWNDALIPVVNFDFFDFSLGLSYDVNVSRLKAASQMQGGFELSATYRATLNRRSNFSDAVRCVRF
jgi:type IX secretion system PorP/SprF family membrane protein